MRRDVFIRSFERTALAPVFRMAQKRHILRQRREHRLRRGRAPIVHYDDGIRRIPPEIIYNMQQLFIRLICRYHNDHS